MPIINNGLLIGVLGLTIFIVIYLLKDFMSAISKLPELIGRFNELLEEFKKMIDLHNDLDKAVNVLKVEIKNNRALIDELRADMKSVRESRNSVGNDLHQIYGKILVLEEYMKEK